VPTIVGFGIAAIAVLVGVIGFVALKH